MAPQNPLPIHGNERTMNLNTMILTNIQSSPYFKVNLYELKTYHEVIDEIYYKVDHLEPWEKGSRKTSGQTGMCGGVRGVGAGGIVSSAYCLLYKLFTLRLTHKQLQGLITHSDSPYIRGLGFMYIRYTQHPGKLWDWYEEYLEDEEEIDVKAGGGHVMTMGELVRQWLVKLEWYSTLFPRIPVPIQKDLEVKLRDYDAIHTPMPEPPPPEPEPQPQEEGGEEPSFGEAERIARLRMSASPSRGASRELSHSREIREKSSHKENQDRNSRDDRHRDDRTRDHKDDRKRDVRRDHRDDRSRDERRQDHRSERYRDDRPHDSKDDRGRDRRESPSRKDRERDRYRENGSESRNRDRESDRPKNREKERDRERHREMKEERKDKRRSRSRDKDRSHKEHKERGSKDRDRKEHKEHKEKKRSHSQERDRSHKKHKKRSHDKDGRESSFERDLRREKARQKRDRYDD